MDNCLPRRDSADPRTWSTYPLRYSHHARERCDQRDIPVLYTLPRESKLADLDKDSVSVQAMLFKVPHELGDFFVVLSSDGCVLTTFRKGAEWKTYRSGKERRRRFAMCC